MWEGVRYYILPYQVAGKVFYVRRAVKQEE